MTKRIVVVVGQGYVGLPVAVRAAEVGYQVVGYELNEARVESLLAGVSHVEDIPNERLRPLLHDGSYRPTAVLAEIAGFDIAVISVPTPMSEGTPDLSYIESACEAIGRFVTPGCTVILESTTYPGTTDELCADILDAASGLSAGVDYHLGYSPERIDPGNPRYRLENTPKVVSGITPSCLDHVDGFFSRLVEQTVRVSGTREAELTKLLENTFRHVNIALVNELAMFAHDLGIDIWEAIDAASTKPFGYMRFTPGPGVGGHCLPIDPTYLSWQIERRLGQTFRFVELANDVNSHMPNYVVQRVQRLLNDLEMSVKGSSVLVFGLAYKANTGDARETPSEPICRLLIELGAKVLVVDPHVRDEQFPIGCTRAFGTVEEINSSDLVLYLVDHDEFDTEALSASTTRVLDCRHALTGPMVHQL